jgi:CRISP-associated protein Cas1
MRLSGPLFDRVASVLGLEEAWKRVLANAGAAGVDGMTVEKFARVAASQIDILAENLVAGRYRPQPARRVYIPKKKGGVRPLDIPTVTDRVVQASAALVLDPILDREMEPSSFAYRRGKSVAQAVARVASLRRQGFRHVVDGDIRAYFERIPHDRLIEKLEAHVEDQALVDLIWLWLETYSHNGRGVPQGSPISPLLANLYLDSVDERIETLGFRLVRFADDWLVLCRSEQQATTALEAMRDLLSEEGLELNLDKTGITSFEEGFRFLGHLFVRSLTLQEIDIDETPSDDAIAAAEAAAKAADRQEQIAFPDAEAEPGHKKDPIHVAYVLQPGRRLEAKGARLLVVDEGQRLMDIPPGTIDRIEIGPDADATLAAMEMAAAHDIEVLRLNGHGETVGIYQAVGNESASRHLNQARMVLDETLRAEQAGRIVQARIHNQRALLRRLNRERDDGKVAEAAAKLSRIILKFKLPRNVDQARGIEGEAAALYWPALGRCMPDGLTFHLRRRGQGMDPGNTALSMLSSMLTRDVRSCLLKTGLHPGFGTLHVPRDGVESLAFDLMEEFRGPVAEACALSLFNRKALRLEMFPKGGTGLRIPPDVWAALVRGYEGWVARPVRSPRTGDQVLWRALMLEQAQAYARACEGGAVYEPYRMDY